MIDETSNDFERADAAREAANQKANQIALRHFRRPWGCHPETPEAEPLEPSDEGDMLAASEAAERQEQMRAEWHEEMRRDAFGDKA